MSLSGKQVSLTYVEPGTWFGDIALFDGLPRTHDAHAHGETTLLVVRKADFMHLLATHVELYDALLRLNCRRLRLMFDALEELNTKPLAARLARQLLRLARSYGVADEQGEVRIGLALAQEDLAQLLGASRQRVNQELKALEREGALRVSPRAWWCDRATSCSRCLSPPEPHMEQFTGTRPVSEQHGFDSASLARWLADHVPGFDGPLAAEQFKGGQSNPTFKLTTPRRTYVMRAKPGPAAKLLPSAHAIEREYRVMAALRPQGVPVPEMLALCRGRIGDRPCFLRDELRRGPRAVEPGAA